MRHPGETGWEGSLDNTAALDAFLRSVERRAYVMAKSMVADQDEALDVVQDAMIRFARRYARRSEEEWPPLFFRIVINRCRDWQRRQAVRNRVMFWRRDETWPDPVATAPGPAGQEPVRQLMNDEAMQTLGEAIRTLPARQQQTFVLRCLEGLSVEDTASAMGCSGGTVKTQYFRALAALREQLGEHWDG